MKGRFHRSFIWEGILMIVLGVLAILFPTISTWAIEMIVGWLCLLGGIIQAIRYFQMPKGTTSYFSFFIAFFYILFGVLIIFFPKEGEITLTLLLGILFFAQGIFQILMGFYWKSAAFKAGLFVSGIVALLLSFLIWSKWPLDAHWVIGLLVGINLIFFGITQLFMVSRPNGT